MNCQITNKGVKVRLAEFWDFMGREDGRLLLGCLTHSYQPAIGPMRVIRNYVYGKRSLYLPRYVLNKLGDEYFMVKNGLQECPAIGELRPTTPPYKNQQLVIDHLMAGPFSEENARVGQSAIILCAATGFGKTVLAFNIASRLGQKAIFIAPNKSIQGQAYEEIQEFFAGAKINLLGGHASTLKKSGMASCPLEEANICLAVINSVIKKISADKRFMCQFGLCIYDEVHMIKSPINKCVLWRGQCKYSLGMSATPDERDDLCDKIYKAHFSNIIWANKVPGFEASSHQFKCHVNFIYYAGPKEFTELIMNPRTGAPDSQGIMSNIVEDPYRLKILGAIIAQICGVENRYLLVFSDRRDYATDLYNEALTHFDGNNELMRGVVLLGGAKNEAATKYARESAKVIFTTYKYSKVGFNVKRINTILFGTPEKAEHAQKVGRGFRYGSDMTITRQIYDIIDAKTIFCHQKKKRLPIYESLGATYKHSNVSYEDVALAFQRS